MALEIDQEPAPVIRPSLDSLPQVVETRIANVETRFHNELSTLRSDIRTEIDGLRKGQEEIKALIPTVWEKRFVLGIFALLAAKVLGVSFEEIRPLFGQ